MYQNNYYVRNGYDKRKMYNNSYKTDIKGGYNGFKSRKCGFNSYSNKYGVANTMNNNNAVYAGYNRNNYYKQKKLFDFKYPRSKRSISYARESGVHYSKRLCNPTAIHEEEQTKVSSAEREAGIGSATAYSFKEMGNMNVDNENHKDIYNYKYREGYGNNNNGYKGSKYNYRDNCNYYRTCYNFSRDGYRDGCATHKYGEQERYGGDFYKNDKQQYWQTKSPNATSHFGYKKRYHRDNFHRRPYNEEYHYSKYDRSPKRTKIYIDRHSDLANGKETIPLSCSGNNQNNMYVNTTLSNTMQNCEYFHNTMKNNNVSNKRQNSNHMNGSDSNENNKIYRKRAKYHNSNSDDCRIEWNKFRPSRSNYMKRRNKKGDRYRNAFSRNLHNEIRKKGRYNKEGESGFHESPSSVDQKYLKKFHKGNQRNKRHRSRENEQYSEDDKKRKKENRHSESPSLSSNASLDKIVHFSWKEGMILDDVYKIERKMGDGTFGRVLLCKHVSTDKEYAIKVIRNKKRYTKSAKIEADILKKIQNNNPQNNNIVKYFGNFMHKNHMCLIFEPLGPSIYEILKRNKFRGFPLEDIKCFCVEILKSLRYLRKIRLTHTDIKPENILLDDPSFQGRVVTVVEQADKREISCIYRTKSTGIRLIDFGCATFSDDYHGSIINTRQYRAPEVILNLGWNEASDMWSLGCVLAEMYTGYLLFKTHDHLEHLALIESRLGPIPKRMLINSLKTNGVQYINKQELRLNWPEGAETNFSENYVRQCAPLSDIVKNKEFCEFLRFILEIDPFRRPTPTEALRHKFLQNVTRSFL